jgi:hypothetical protein
MMDQFKNIYDCKSKEYTSPLENGDNLEVNTSEELDEKGIKLYQTMIGCLQWAGFMDIKINVSSQEASYHMFPTYNDNK